MGAEDEVLHTRPGFSAETAAAVARDSPILDVVVVAVMAHFQA